MGVQYRAFMLFNSPGAERCLLDSQRRSLYTFETTCARQRRHQGVPLVFERREGETCENLIVPTKERQSVRFTKHMF